MESIKKLEEKWMMNQQKHAGGENIAGLKDESSNWISNGEVILKLVDPCDATFFFVS